MLTEQFAEIMRAQVHVFGRLFHGDILFIHLADIEQRPLMHMGPVMLLLLLQAIDQPLQPGLRA